MYTDTRTIQSQTLWYCKSPRCKNVYSFSFRFLLAYVRTHITHTYTKHVYVVLCIFCMYIYMCECVLSEVYVKCHWTVCSCFVYALSILLYNSSSYSLFYFFISLLFCFIYLFIVAIGLLISFLYFSSFFFGFCLCGSISLFNLVFFFFSLYLLEMYDFLWATSIPLFHSFYFW